MNYYVDMHSNLLPGLPGLNCRPLTDAESATRLAAFRESNIKLAVAAPYYQPDSMPPESFLSLRDQKTGALKDSANLRIAAGAVLPFSYCLEAARSLQDFVLGDSGYILIDLPREPISESFCESVKRLRIVSGLCPVAVDIDRFFDIWELADLAALRQTGILLQISVNGLLRQEHRKLSLFLLANQYAHFVATGSREIEEPLCFIEAMRVIQRSIPAQLYRRIKNNAGMLLSDAEPSSFF